MGRRSLLDWLGIQQWRAAGAIDLKSLASLNRVDICSSAQFLSISPIPKYCVSGGAISAIHHAATAAAMQYIVLGVTTIVVDIIVMIGTPPLLNGLLYGLKDQSR